MTTTVNGRAADWPPEVRAKWARAMRHIEDDRPVERANYFTPRPRLDEWNRGSREEGFVYVRGRDVFQVVIRRHARIGGDS